MKEPGNLLAKALAILTLEISQFLSVSNKLAAASKSVTSTSLFEFCID
jgi:hypothetical protein